LFVSRHQILATLLQFSGILLGVTDIKHPSFAVIHNNFGIALFADRKNEEAISHFKMAIKLQPNLSDAHYNLGYALVQKGEMKEAAHHFLLCLEMIPCWRIKRATRYRLQT